jgi:hypothetical protein
MLNLIGVLLLSGQLGVSVESPSGRVERVFVCNAAGVEELFEFVLSSLGSRDPGIQFVVGPVERANECEDFFFALAENGIGNAAVSSAELEAFAISHSVAAVSSRTVAEVFREKHASLFRATRT